MVIVVLYRRDDRGPRDDRPRDDGVWRRNTDWERDR